MEKINNFSSNFDKNKTDTKTNWDDKYGKFVVLTASDSPWFSNPDIISPATDINKTNNENKSNPIHPGNHFIQKIHKDFFDNIYRIMSCLLIFIIILQLIYIN